MDKRLFLLDAYALVFRAYYALIRSPRITTKNKNTNAQFGFTNTLVELITKQKPTHMAVCFDTHELTERHTDFVDYKANRQETPEDILIAVPDIKRIIKGFNIPVIEAPGYEADDIIGTLSKKAADEGYEVFMVTSDKDYGQLVSEKIKIYKPGYQGSDVEIMGPEQVCAKWNIRNVSQVIDVLGLMGDSVDNIPGIAGVGEKTAAKLLAEYETLENVVANAENIKGALGKKVQEGKEMAILSKKLATIITDVPVEFHEENFQLKDWNREELKSIFAELEFRTLARRLLGEEVAATVTTTGSAASKTSSGKGVQIDLFGNVIGGDVIAAPLQPEAEEEDAPSFPGLKTINDAQPNYKAVTDEKDIKALVEELLPVKEISFDTETTNIDANLAELVGLSFSIKAGQGYYIPCPADQEATRKTLQWLRPLFDDEDKLWIGQNLKYDLLVLKWYGVGLNGAIFDTMLAHYVIEPDGKRNMDFLSEKFLGYKPIPIGDLIGKKGKTQGNMRDVEIEKAKDYAVEDADITLQLKAVFEPLLKKRQVQKVFDEVENPLVQVLTDMEFEGVRIDEEFLKNYSQELEKEAAAAEKNVFEIAGVRFNLASPKQLGEVLFDKLKLDPSARKTKTGQYQTGEDVLLKLAARGHVIADEIIAFRELTKLRSTYVDALPQLINPKTGRVHTTYGQAVAVTGRLASNNPNLQNIPVRTERGKEIRKAFIPRDEKHVLLSADYSQIELRIVAAISGDTNMVNAFKNGTDIHTATASKVFNVAMEEVTKEMRYKSKSVNFGIIYGQGAFGLADNLGISRTEAKGIIESYKKEFSGIQKYMDDMINFAREHGYVQTLMGRKRWLKDINSSNFTVRGFAERNAINSPIQGTAADMIKLAMQKVYTAMKKEKMKSRMILQVHDELIFDAVRDEVQELRPLILENMESALPLPFGVPVVAECGEGNNWLEAH
ncbi:DNA polymerase I [Niabella ginsenosidivorans]|uniref:DNA polymerase I n=1 Tax=Niabella ginsenosidivorans TaxID=1176587 RepID=A0A1A9I6Z2_9BACT|nr:DNA polymerase I [Niabella ginsenosidivorans]ANH83386.1 DNA polymerase I [Niabella ginsenosidivorans]